MDDLSAAEATITLRAFDSYTVLYLNGHLDFTNVAWLDAAFRQCDRAGTIVSFEGVTFGDCSVLTSLIRLHAATHGELVVVLPPASRVTRLFALTRVAEHLRIVPDRAQAIALVTQARCR